MAATRHRETSGTDRGIGYGDVDGRGEWKRDAKRTSNWKQDVDPGVGTSLRTAKSEALTHRGQGQESAYIATRGTNSRAHAADELDPKIRSTSRFAKFAMKRTVGTPTDAQRGGGDLPDLPLPLSRPKSAAKNSLGFSGSFSSSLNISMIS